MIRITTRIRIVSTFKRISFAFPTFEITPCTGQTTANGCEETIDIFIDTDGNPVTISEAGDDTETCETEFQLLGNMPADGEEGFWTLISGSGDIESSMNAQTMVYNLGFGINTFSWSLENECGSNASEISITVINCQPTIVPLEFFSCLDLI